MFVYKRGSRKDESLLSIGEGGKFRIREVNTGTGYGRVDKMCKFVRERQNIVETTKEEDSDVRISSGISCEKLSFFRKWDGSQFDSTIQRKEYRGLKNFPIDVNDRVTSK